MYVGDKYDEDICQYVIRYHESLIHTLLAYLVYLVIIILILFRVFMKEDNLSFQVIYVMYVIVRISIFNM